MHVFVTCKYKRVRIKTTVKRLINHFPHYKSMGAFCCHGNQNFDQIFRGANQYHTVFYVYFPRFWPPAPLQNASRPWGTECSLHTNKPQVADFRKILMTITESIWHLAITCPSIQRLITVVWNSRVGTPCNGKFLQYRTFDIINWRMYMGAWQLQVLYYLSSEQQRCWSECADAQANLHIYCFFSWPGSYLLKTEKVPLCERSISFFTTTNKKLTENKIHTVYFFLIRILFKRSAFSSAHPVVIVH